jgi:hypothetical protein
MALAVCTKSPVIHLLTVVMSHREKGACKPFLQTPDNDTFAFRLVNGFNDHGVQHCSVFSITDL